MITSEPWPPALSGALATSNAGSWEGAPVIYLRETGSTNDDAARCAAEGAASGTIVVAGAQTAGRGRRGRTWASPPDAGLYFSVVLRPPRSLHDDAANAARATSLLTLAAAVACVRGIERAAGFSPQIKWPNDLVVDHGQDRDSGRWHRRKLAGILAEGAASGTTLEHVVVGIGINVTPAAYPPEVASLATSIAAEAGRPVDAFAVFAACRAAVADEVDALFRGAHERMLERWRSYAPMSDGARITWTTAAERLEGTTRGIDDSGALLVEVDGRGIERITSGEVQWL